MFDRPAEAAPPKGYVVRILGGWLQTREGGSGPLTTALRFRLAESAYRFPFGEAVYSLGLALELEERTKA